MPDPSVKFTLDVTADCDAVLESYCVKFLAGKGYTLVPPSAPWERGGRFCKRVGITPSTLNAMVRRFTERGGIAPKLARRGISKRVMAIQSNPAFDQFCLSLKRNGS
jgi:hypothetical protein